MSGGQTNGLFVLGLCTFGLIVGSVATSHFYLSKKVSTEIVKAQQTVLNAMPDYRDNLAINVTRNSPGWDSAAGRDMARKIGASSRLSDIAAYLLTSEQRQVLNKNDLSVLSIAEKQIAFDSEMALAMASLSMHGFTQEVVQTDYGYVLRGVWELHAENNTPFGEVFPVGAKLLLHAESMVMPQCKTGSKPVLLYALMNKAGAEKQTASIQEENGRWRVFITGKTPYEYRVIADAGCVDDGVKLGAEPAQPGSEPSDGSGSTAKSETGKASE